MIQTYTAPKPAGTFYTDWCLIDQYNNYIDQDGKIMFGPDRGNVARNYYGPDHPEPKILPFRLVAIFEHDNRVSYTVLCKTDKTMIESIEEDKDNLIIKI